MPLDFRFILANCENRELAKLLMFKEVLNFSYFLVSKNPKNFEPEECLIQAKRFKWLIVFCVVKMQG